MEIKLPPACTECEKMYQLRDKTEVIGEFLEWLLDNYSVCDWDEENNRYEQRYQNIEQWLAEYFDIDLNKVEREKTALLQWIREQNQSEKQ